MDATEIKSLLEKQGEAFEAFKQTIESELKSKLAADDPLVKDKLAKIEQSLDGAVEAKAALEAAIAAEKKEREDLELRINRSGIKAGSVDAAKIELELKDFNRVIAGIAAERKRQVAPVDQKGYDEYKSAFDHLLREGKENLTPDEVKTLSVGSDPDGGYYVTPDVSGRIVTQVYESSPIRQIASAQTISTDALEGIEDLDEAGAGYAGEHATSGNTDTPQVGKWRIPVYWIDTEPKATQQLLDDAMVDIEAWLSGKVSDKFARFENAEFVTGTSKIRGLTSYTTALDSGAGVTWGTVGHVISGASGDFDATNPGDRLHDLVGALKNEYLTSARFLTRRSVITKIRKFKDGQGNDLWQPSFVIGQPESLVGYPITRAEDMPALGANSLSLAFGDFGRGYQIVDRQGVRVMRDPFTSKPYVKFYTTKRTGGGVVNFEAFKVMKFTA